MFHNILKYKHIRKKIDAYAINFREFDLMIFAINHKYLMVIKLWIPN